jgi:hypothetical protein
MTRVSLATLRLTNHSARVTIACDQLTHQALQASGSQLFHEADAVLGFPTPDGPPTYRNRYVKTQLGSQFDGPFLFLDSDTVVRKPLTSLLDLHCDIAAAPNHSRDTLAEQIWSEDQVNLDAMGWQVREPYVNGGVIWYGGSPGSRRFSDAWHQNWQASVEATGRYRDQPALNATLRSSCASLQILDHRWNAQVSMNPEMTQNVVITHHYASRSTGKLDPATWCLELLQPDRPLLIQPIVVCHLLALRSTHSPPISLLDGCQDLVTWLARFITILMIPCLTWSR